MTAHALCIGVANVDVIAHVDTAFLLRHRIEKNTSTLMRSEDLLELIPTLDRPVIVPGGCSANTACGIAAQGIQTRFIGAIHDDSYGAIFREAFKDYGVAFDPVMCADKFTAICLTLVTPDKDRSFVFSPNSASWSVSRFDLPELNPDQETFIYTETNLFRMTAGAERASLLDDLIAKYKNPKHKIILGLIDTEITEKNRQALHQMIKDKSLYMIISNHEELMALFNTHDRDDALKIASGMDQLFITTLGRHGAAIVTPDNIEIMDTRIIPSEEIVDTVGAGDQFAAGVIAALANGKDLKAACAVGAQCAAEVLKMVGARPAIADTTPHSIDPAAQAGA